MQATLVAQQQLNQQLTQQMQLLMLERAPPAEPRRQPRSAAIDRLPMYAGLSTDSLDEWLDTLNRVAEVEDWDAADRRRVAISKLSGAAAQWHDRVGLYFPIIQAWTEQLRSALEHAAHDGRVGCPH